jgi:hypothetical protein
MDLRLLFCIVLRDNERIGDNAQIELHSGEMPVYGRNFGPVTEIPLVCGLPGPVATPNEGSRAAKASGVCSSGNSADRIIARGQPPTRTSSVAEQRRMASGT